MTQDAGQDAHPLGAFYLFGALGKNSHVERDSTSNRHVLHAPNDVGGRRDPDSIHTNSKFRLRRSLTCLQKHRVDREPLQKG